MMNIGDGAYMILYPYNQNRIRWDGMEPVGIFLCDILEKQTEEAPEGRKTTYYRLKDRESNVEFWSDEFHCFSEKEETRETMEKLLLNTFLSDIKGYVNDIELAIGNIRDAGINIDEYMGKEDENKNA